MTIITPASPTPPPSNTPATAASMAPVLDTLQRPLRDLRISVTDRCNFRCVYCMPKEIFGAGYPFLTREETLSFEEITRLARAFVANGVTKLRLTGGEPLVRRDLEKLVGMLCDIDGVTDVALTTNGSLLTARKAKALKAAGLHRITISLDSMDDRVFRSMNDVGFPVDKVLTAIDTAVAAGLNPVKIDMVVKRGMNEDSILGMAEHFRGTGVILRFIEFMDVGTTNGWRMDDVVSGAEILQKIESTWAIEPVDPNYVGEVAERWRYMDGQGEFGLITSVTQPFCGDCSRARLSSDGQLYTCLFGTHGHDLRTRIRSGASDAELAEALRGIWSLRTDRYSEVRSSETTTLMLRKVEMSRIGG